MLLYISTNKKVKALLILCHLNVHSIFYKKLIRIKKKIHYSDPVLFLSALVSVLFCFPGAQMFKEKYYEPYLCIVDVMITAKKHRCAIKPFPAQQFYHKMEQRDIGPKSQSLKQWYCQKHWKWFTREIL